MSNFEVSKKAGRLPFYIISYNAVRCSETQRNSKKPRETLCEILPPRAKKPEQEKKYIKEIDKQP